MNSNLLRNLPKVDELLNEERILSFADEIPRSIIAQKIRDVLDERRAILLSDEAIEVEDYSYERIVEKIVNVLSLSKIKSLRKVINATGIVLHTNLGRANLSKYAAECVAEAATSYSTLEYDPVSGKRGSRHSHVEAIIKAVTGAEAAMVVNNNAAATMLCLAALCRGKEVIISRGELVEIGGSFRIPEIMEESGATLVEVGTTNKTKLADYENKIGEDTAALMKVHTSNYKIIGFTEDVSIEELKKLGTEHDIPVIADLGSGLMVDLADRGVKEPTVHSVLKSGADVVLFSGDKLFGGPQAGIIIGKREFVDKMKSHPLARVLRVDKMTIAAVVATFEAYLDKEKCMNELPVLSMITAAYSTLVNRASELEAQIKTSCKKIETRIIDTDGMVGGGSAPGIALRSVAVDILHSEKSVDELAEALREGQLPIITRIHNDKLRIDVRTITDDEIPLIVQKLATI